VCAGVISRLEVARERLRGLTPLKVPKGRWRLKKSHRSEVLVEEIWFILQKPSRRDERSRFSVEN
jgi:hypothetical protein